MWLVSLYRPMMMGLVQIFQIFVFFGMEKCHHFGWILSVFEVEIMPIYEINDARLRHETNVAASVGAGWWDMILILLWVWLYWLYGLMVIRMMVIFALTMQFEMRWKTQWLWWWSSSRSTIWCIDSGAFKSCLASSDVHLTQVSVPWRSYIRF